MASKLERERVMREILYPELTSVNPHELELSPRVEDLEKFAELLVDSVDEEHAQRFLARRPAFLIGEAGFSDSSTLAFITKPRIGARFVADFAVMQANQGGCPITLYEIERPSAGLFTKNLTPSRTYQSAIGQVTKWRQWIARTERTFASDMLALARTLPQWPKRSVNQSFRIPSVQRLGSLWQMFGGDRHPFFSYAIICGRWATMTQDERNTLVFLNGSDKGNWYKTYTFDQLARHAYRRPFLDWENESPGSD